MNLIITDIITCTCIPTGLSILTDGIIQGHVLRSEMLVAGVLVSVDLTRV